MKSKTPIFNPRAKTAWSEDGSKFGQRMLEKMGWTPGQGLGANNQGMTENLKIKWKMDNNGLGFKIQDNQAWNQVEESFSIVLSELKKKSDNITEYANEDIKVNSLESTSQSSKSRVHYHKYTRGKDVSRYKQEDLAGILGKGWSNLCPSLSLPTKSESNVENYEIDSNKSVHKMTDDITSESETPILLPKKVKMKSNIPDKDETNCTITIEEGEKMHNTRKNKKRKHAKSDVHNDGICNNKVEKLAGYLDLKDEKQNPVMKKNELKNQNENGVNTKENELDSRKNHNKSKHRKRKCNEDEKPVENSNENKPKKLKSSDGDDIAICKQLSSVPHKEETASKRKKRSRAKKSKKVAFLQKKNKTRVFNQFDRRAMKLEIKKKVMKNELQTSFKGSNIEEIKGYGS